MRERICETVYPTLCVDNLSLENIFQPHQQDFSKWANHCEDHPNIYHLDVRGAWKCLADSNETKRTILFKCSFSCTKRTYNVARTSMAVKWT